SCLMVRCPPRPTRVPYTTLFRSALAGDRVEDGEVELLVIGTQLDHEVEGHVHDLVGPRVLPVDLVDDDDGPEAFRQRLPQHEPRSEEHTSELQSRETLVCRLLLE